MHVLIDKKKIEWSMKKCIKKKRRASLIFHLNHQGYLISVAIVYLSFNCNYNVLLAQPVYLLVPDFCKSVFSFFTLLFKLCAQSTKADLMP